ncbi:MAG TPA: histidine phosphatase family protein [Nocardioidaceae bacterium]|nr:histidine phosphatase family protein [Nocardioidaceae bacterium]
MGDLQCAVRVLCARHAAAEDGPGPAGDDQPLTQTGCAQADRLGRRLATQRVAHVYTSPLRPARETATRVAESLQIRSTVDDRLSELTAGAADTSADPDGADPDDADPDGAERVTDAVRAWLDGDLARPAAGGETGQQVVARLSGVLEEVADLHRGETVLLVTHGGLLTLGLTVLSANLKPAWVSQRELGNTDLVDMRYDGDGWVCGSWAGDVPR